MDKNELQHWGIKGMKWGVRRYQNKDGSLTPAGKDRYDDDESDHYSVEERRARSDRGKKIVNRLLAVTAAAAATVVLAKVLKGKDGSTKKASDAGKEVVKDFLGGKGTTVQKPLWERQVWNKKGRMALPTKLKLPKAPKTSSGAGKKAVADFLGGAGKTLQKPLWK